MGRKAERAHGEADSDAGFTPKRAKNAVRVAKVIVPAAVPALAPMLVRAAGALREAYDRHRARRMGIDVERLPEFSGRGGALLARIAGAANGLAQLTGAPSATDDDRAFTDRSRRALEQLTASVRAAEHMPASRRAAAHRAVGGELDAIERELLRRLGV